MSSAADEAVQATAEAILAARARRLAAPIQQTTRSAEAEALLFRIGKALYALETRFVLRVAPALRVTALPRPVGGLWGVTQVGVGVVAVLRLGGRREGSASALHIILGSTAPALVMEADELLGVRPIHGLAEARTLAVRPGGADGDDVRGLLLEEAVVLLDGATLLRARAGAKAAADLAPRAPSSRSATR